MKDLLFNKTFDMTSPQGFREIKFDEPFTDHEYDKWEVVYNSGIYTLLLYKNGTKLCNLRFDSDKLTGYDLRGGVTTVSPTSNNRKQFLEYFKPNRKASVPPPKAMQVALQINKTSDVAVVTNFDFPNFDCYQPLKSMYKTFEDLFLAGYTYVLVVDKPLKEGAVSLLNNLIRSYELPIASVQVVSQSDEGKPNELQQETGDFSCYGISYMTWNRIRVNMSDASYNFSTNLKRSFQQRKFKRLSTKISRLNYTDPQDSRRKNFEVLDV